MNQPVIYTDKNSTIYKLRLKRFNLFLSFIAKIKAVLNVPSIRILDVGGTLIYWKTFEYTDVDYITVLNITVNEELKYEKISLLAGDATNMNQFRNNEFDVVFSNSVIEHVGDDYQKSKMRDEILRVGKYSFIQTPNYYFPIEPHYRFPFFFLVPKTLQLFLFKNFHLRQRRKRKLSLSNEETILESKKIQLLKLKEFRQLFPKNTIIKEKYLWLTKSFISHSIIK